MSVSVREGVDESSLSSCLPCAENHRVLATLCFCPFVVPAIKCIPLFSNAGARAGLPQCEVAGVCWQATVRWKRNEYESHSRIAGLMVLMRIEPG